MEGERNWTRKKNRESVHPRFIEKIRAINIGKESGKRCEGGEGARREPGLSRLASQRL